MPVFVDNGFFIPSSTVASYVVQVKIIKNDKSEFTEAEVIHVFKEKIDHKTILIGGISSCEVYFGDAPVGSKWFLAFGGRSGSFMLNQPGKIPSYSISICGRNYLKVVKDNVIGRIDGNTYDDKPQKMNVELFSLLLLGELINIGEIWDNISGMILILAFFSFF